MFISVTSYTINFPSSELHRKRPKHPHPIDIDSGFPVSTAKCTRSQALRNARLKFELNSNGTSKHFTGLPT